MLALAILAVLIVAFEKRHKEVRARHDAALEGVRGECAKLSERGLPRKQA